MSWTDDDRFELKMHSTFNKPIAVDIEELSSAHELVNIQKHEPLGEGFANVYRFLVLYFTLDRNILVFVFPTEK